MMLNITVNKIMDDFVNIVGQWKTWVDLQAHLNNHTHKNTHTNTHTHSHFSLTVTIIIIIIIIFAGMLSQEELLMFTGPPGENVQLTRAAVKRIFEENITYKPMDMDYKVRSIFSIL